MPVLALDCLVGSGLTRSDFTVDTCVPHVLSELVHLLSKIFCALVSLHNFPPDQNNT